MRKDSRKIFEGLKITEQKEFCDKWMNQYPVLFVSFKDVEAENFHDAYDMLKTRLADVCKKLSGLAGDDRVNQFDSETFVRLEGQTGNTADVKNALKTIMRMMRAVYGKKVILLIDEYDVPLARASEKNNAQNAFYSSMLDVIKGIMGTSLKDNEYLEFAVVTGCLRIAKESLFTGTNNFASYSVLDEDFSQYFGFSEKEVEALLIAADRSEAAAIMKEWYDGYVFGNSCVYCPFVMALPFSKNRRKSEYLNVTCNALAKRMNDGYNNGRNYKG